MTIPGKKPAEKVLPENFWGKGMGCMVDWAVFIPGAGVDEDAGIPVGEVVCGVDVDIDEDAGVPVGEVDCGMVVDIEKVVGKDTIAVERLVG